MPARYRMIRLTASPFRNCAPLGGGGPAAAHHIHHAWSGQAPIIFSEAGGGRPCRVIAALGGSGGGRTSPPDSFLGSAALVPIWLGWKGMQRRRLQGAGQREAAKRVRSAPSSPLLGCLSLPVVTMRVPPPYVIPHRIPQEGASTAPSAAAPPLPGDHPEELPDQIPRKQGRSETAPKGPQQQPRRRRQPASDVVLLVGFAQEEVRLIRDNVGLVFPSPPPPPPLDATADDSGATLTGADSSGGSSGGVGLPAVMGVGRAASKRLVGGLVDKARALQQERYHQGEVADGSDGVFSSSSSTPPSLDEALVSASPSEEDSTVETRGGLAEGRVVLLLGTGVQQHGGAINDVLLSLGIAPAVIGAVLPHQKSLPLEVVVAALRMTHARCVAAGGAIKGCGTEPGGCLLGGYLQDRYEGGSR